MKMLTKISYDRIKREFIRFKRIDIFSWFIGTFRFMIYGREEAKQCFDAQQFAYVT